MNNHNKLRTLLSFNKKLYNQVWDNYENAIDCRDFEKQEICSNEIYRIKIRISWIKKEMTKEAKREIAKVNKKIEIIELPNRENEKRVLCCLHDVNKKKQFICMVG